MFQALFVHPSADKELLGHTKSLSIIGDGTPVETGARSYGKFLCECRKKGKWRCPAKVCKWECPHPCSDSEYGRTFYTSTSENPRLFPRVKRDSKEWYKRYSLRTGIERCIKRQKVDYQLEDSKGRSSRHWTVRSYLIAMCQHVDVWFKEAKKRSLFMCSQAYQRTS